jgi:alcohol dehydrogenase (NADP+)
MSCAFDERDTHESSSLSVLDVHRRFVIVGLRAEPLPGFNAMFLLSNGSFIGGSHIESKKECLQIPPLAADKGAKPWITLLPMSDAKKTVEAVKQNDLEGKYRFVLTLNLKEAKK